MRQHGIWTTVNSDANYACDRSFGARHQYGLDVRVGTSSSNSHYLGNVAVTRRWYDNCWIATICVDGNIIVQKRYDEKWNEIPHPLPEPPVPEPERVPEVPRKRKVVTRRTVG